MNPKKVFEIIQKDWSNISFEATELTADVARFKADIVAEKYFDDGIFTKVVVYKSGVVHVFFTFDELDRVAKHYELINEFNDNTSFAKAYITTINGNNFLQLHYAFYSSADEVDAADNISFSLNNLLNESVLKVLQPLTRLTR